MKTFLVERCTALKAAHGEQHKQPKQAIARLVDFCEAWNKPDKLAEYRLLLPKPN